MNRPFVRTILVSAYLSGTEQAKKLAYFERLDACLRQHNSKLYLVNRGRECLTTPCEHTTIPLCVPLADRFPGDYFLSENHVSPELIKAASVEAEIRGSTLLSSTIKVLFFRAFMRKILLRRKPALCVIWHQFNGLHRSLAHLCDEMGIPYIFAEYGVLPGTIVLEKGGQMAESWVATNNVEFLHLPIDDHHLAVAQHFLSVVRRERRSRKEQSSRVSIDSIVDSRRNQGRKMVFYAGQNDPDTGMVPSWLPEARTHSPFFADTLDALNCLSELAHRNNWHVLFKPHPSLQGTRQNLVPNYPDRVDLVVGANVFNCIAQTDVTVTILSQVSYLALIHGRPCLLLGRNQLSGKGCAYELTSPTETENLLQKAMQMGFTQRQKALWLRHVAQLCRHYLFSFEEDIDEIIGRGVDDAARYIFRHCLGSHTTQPHLSRLARGGKGLFGNDCAGGQWLALRGLYLLLLVFNMPLRGLRRTRAGLTHCPPIVAAKHLFSKGSRRTASKCP